MPDRIAIYRDSPEVYDLLISREDYEGNLLKVLKRIVHLKDKDIADLGAGTGRLTSLLTPLIRSSLLTDSSEAMLKIAEQKLYAINFQGFTTHVSDIGEVPADDKSFDIVFAGWALISKAFRGNPWQKDVKESLEEMIRVTRPGGVIILVESLGTGQENPHPPNDRFADYFELLEKQEGFEKISIRTDYKFTSLEEKEKLLSFFFDKEMLDAGTQNNSLVYPECTGIWWKVV
jgi:ubiquinone/menaquinone biosynthesis C-methylase UbiE